MIETQLRDNVVHVTGANHGIGAATPGAFAAEGAAVAVRFLEALAACGYAADSRFRALAQKVREKQRNDGRWLLEGGSTAVRIERKGHPSKWITLKALRVLKEMEEG